VAVLKQFGILFVLGSLGIILFVVTSILVIQQQLATLPAATAAQLPPFWVLLVLRGLQYKILLAIAVLAGIFCTPSVGLYSHLINSCILLLEWPAAGCSGGTH
jgi:hypothetical protein